MEWERLVTTYKSNYRENGMNMGILSRSLSRAVLYNEIVSAVYPIQYQGPVEIPTVSFTVPIPLAPTGTEPL